MTNFQTTRVVETPKFFEQLSKSNSSFPYMPEFRKQQPESASPLPWSAGVLKNVKSKYR
jgi:hypothetical protein